MALGTIPPWLQVSPADFVRAASEGAQAGLAVARLNQAADEAAQRSAEHGKEFEEAQALRRWEQQQQMQMHAEQMRAAQQKSKDELAARTAYQTSMMDARTQAEKDRQASAKALQARWQADHDLRVKSATRPFGMSGMGVWQQDPQTGEWKQTAAPASGVSKENSAEKRTLITKKNNLDISLAGEVGKEEPDEKKIRQYQSEIEATQLHISALDPGPMTPDSGTNINRFMPPGSIPPPGPSGAAIPPPVSVALPPGPAMPTVLSKDQWDALPPGAQYLNKEGRKFKKPDAPAAIAPVVAPIPEPDAAPADGNKEER